jgi:hypothetical protein
MYFKQLNLQSLKMSLETTQLLKFPRINILTRRTIEIFKRRKGNSAMKRTDLKFVLLCYFKVEHILGKFYTQE